MVACILSPHGCWVLCLLSVVGWWLVASGLLFFTWNKVIAALTSAKQARFWQALLVVATLFVFCVPRYMAQRGHSKYSASCQHSCCQKKGSCPHSFPQKTIPDEPSN
jgi:hypothetical protein